jgi:hypothetical protein
MAGRRQTTPATTDTPELSAGGWQVGTLHKVQSGGRASAPNPMAGAVDASLANGTALMQPVPGDKGDARAVTNGLRRDAGDKDVRLHIQYQDANGNLVRVEKDPETKKLVFPDAIASVHWLATAGKTARKYTTNDIRVWHEQETGEKLTGKVPANVREAYKVAHGYAKSTKSDDTDA